MFRFNLDRETDKSSAYDGEVNLRENNLLHPDNYSAQALLGSKHSSVRVKTSNESSTSQRPVESLSTASSLL